MKLTTLFLIVALFEIQADSYSQNTKLTLKFNEISLEQVFSEIESVSEFRFLFESDIINLNRKVSINVRKKKISYILGVLFKNTNIDYKTFNRQILLSKNERTDNNLSISAQQSISGSIKDVNGQPLAGANIIEKGTSIGAQTDFDGNFSINVKDNNAVLVISYVGFVTQEIAVGNQTTINVLLEEDLALLDEVVIVGYGTQKKVNLTGAINVIGSELLESRSSPSISQLLLGTAPSLSFSIGNNGFSPGANLGLQIRGMGSINGGGSPYILIDGIPGNLNNLNPEDVESISVLKDAAASAIYGAKAPYGVILVTTKSGKNQKMHVSYSGSYAVASPQNLPEMLNSYTHARVINEAGTSRPGAGGRFFSNTIVDNITAFQAGDFEFLRSRPNFPTDATHYETTPRSGGNTWGFNQFGNANRDWFDEYYGTGAVVKHDISVSGGSDRVQYYFSTGIFEQEGALNYGEDTFRRLNVIAKIKVKINDNWDFTYRPRFAKKDRLLPNMDKQGNYDLIFHQIARSMPTNALYDGYGNTMIQSKIPWVRDAGTDRTETIENWQSFTTQIRPLEGLKINADFSFRNTNLNFLRKELTVYDNLVDQSQVPSGNTVPSSILSRVSLNNYWTTNIYTSYDFDINDKHNFSVMAGVQLEETQYKLLQASRSNIIVQDVVSIDTADGEISANEDLYTRSTQGYFGRFKYNFNEKYLLEANIRRDGTSRYKSGSRWGVFPSFSAGWNVDKESFWEPISRVVNKLKFRGSWGELGNQNVTPYQDLPLISLSGNPVNWIFDGTGTRPIGYANTPSLVSSDLTWETARTTNLGVNMAFLNQKLTVDFDWFERETYDMVGPVIAQPGVLGANVPQTNNATLNSKGWEVNLNWKQTLDSGLSYSIGLNLYDSRAVVTKYLNPTGLISSWYEGKQQGEIWGYTVNDLYRTQEEVDAYTAAVDLSDISAPGGWQTGDVKYEDITGDGKVDNGTGTLDDHGDWHIIGNSTPHYQYGFNARVNYKGFDFSMIWKGVGERDVFFNRSQNIFWGFRTGNQSSLFPHHLDYFRDTPGDEYTGVELGDANFNTDAYFPRPYINNGRNNKNRITSTRYLQNGAYLRLQNAQIGYNLPNEVANKIGLNKLRLYVSGENLLTITDLPVGIDPIAVGGSYGAGKTYGADRIISLGLKISY